jgi:uncharacterized protein (DUF433 family)
MKPSDIQRITHNPNIMGGKPTIRDTRVTVGTLLGLLSEGCSAEEILREYPYLEADDIRQTLAYAAWRLSEESDLPLNPA